MIYLFLFIFLVKIIFSQKGNDVERRMKDNLNRLEQTMSEEGFFYYYKNLFNKNFDINSNEGKRKSENLKKNREYINNRMLENPNLKLSINHLADETMEEFKNKRLFDFDIIEKNPIPESSIPLIDKKKNGRFLQEVDNSIIDINWSSFVDKALNQGECGSCWAFATKQAIELNHFIKFGVRINLSAQQMVDCDTTALGCNGGSPRNAMMRIMRNGITNDNLYPYTATQGVCNLNMTNNFVLEASELCAPNICNREKLIELLSKGPVVSTLDADNLDFVLYDDGILDYTCAVRNHAIVLVGYYKDSTQEYFIGLNSYGPVWGNNGLFKFNVKGRDDCFLSYQAILPKLILITQDRPKPCINFYPLEGYDGTPFELCTNNNNIDNLNGVISFSNPTYQSVTLYSGKGCTGTSAFLNMDSSNLATSIYSSLVNNINSIVFNNNDPVLPEYVRLYDQSCYIGNYIDFKDSIGDLNSLNFALKTSSLKMNRVGFTSIQLYTGLYFTGIFTTVTANRPNLNLTFDKKIQSIKFIR